MACTLGVQHLQQPMIVASDGKLLGWLESRMARVTNRVSASLYNHEAGHVQGATPSRGSGAASAFIPLLTPVSEATHHILGHPLKQARCKCATACKAVRRSWKLVLRMGTITAMLHSCARDPQAHTRKMVNLYAWVESPSELLQTSDLLPDLKLLRKLSNLLADEFHASSS